MRRSRASALLLLAALVAAILPLMASSVAAAPVSDVVIAAGHDDAGDYHLEYNYAVQAMLQDSTNFGPTGTVTVDSITVRPDTAVVTDTYLSGVHIFFDGWVRDPGLGTPEWTSAELDSLEAWVTAGGVLILNDDSSEADALANRFDATSLGVTGVGTPNTGYTPTGSHPILSSPFGTWASVETNGTIGHFGLPAALDPAWTPTALDDDGNVAMAVRSFGAGTVILSADEGIWRYDAPTDTDEVAGPIDNDKERALANIFAFAISQTDDGGSNQTPTAVDTTISGIEDEPITSLDLCTLSGVSLGDTPTAVTFSTSLPAGLAAGGTGNCTIGGTPTAPFTADVDYTLTDDDGDTDSATISFSIAPAPGTNLGVPLATDDVAVGRVGEPFNLGVCDNDSLGGPPPTTATFLDGVPAGLSAGGANNCTISGTPTEVGSHTHNYEITDGNGDDSTAQIGLFFDAAATSSGATCDPARGFSFAGSTPGKQTEGDSFGETLASGDFDGDGQVDLAVGAPDDNGGKGSVTVLSSPCRRRDAERYTQSGPVPGRNDANDHFGASLTSGNFNNDNYDDLAIGVPYEDVAGKKNAGAVVVLYGSADGLSRSGGDLFTQQGPVPGRNERLDKFGYALGAGDFNDDGRDDLLIGAPGEAVAGNNKAGGVVMLLGGSDGLGTSGSKSWTQNGKLRGESRAGDKLGYAIGIGDFNGDGIDDAAVGAPYEDQGELKNVGAIHVLRGSRSSGLRLTRQQYFRGTASAQRLGWRLAGGDVTDDASHDLLAGARATSSRGEIHLFTGAGGGLSHSDMVSQASSNASSPRNGDRFGSGLAIVDFDGDGVGEAAIGVPGEDYPGVSNGGAVHIINVGSDGQFDQVTELFRTQADDDAPGILRAGAKFGAALAAGDGELFVGAPGDRVGSVANAGTAAALTRRVRSAVHLDAGDSSVGADIAVGTYRTTAPTGSCEITTRAPGGAARSTAAVSGGSAYLQVTPHDQAVRVSGSCSGFWFFEAL